MGLNSPSWTFCVVKKKKERDRELNHFDIILFKITHIFTTYKPQDLMRSGSTEEREITQ